MDAHVHLMYGTEDRMSGPRSYDHVNEADSDSLMLCGPCETVISTCLAPASPPCETPARGHVPSKWCKSASSCCCCLGGCRLREIGLRKSFVEGQNGGCEVSTSDDPFVVLLSQDGANEAAHGRPVREDAHHIGASPDLLVETLLRVVGPELLPVGEWEAGEGQDVGSRFVQ